MMGPSGYLTVPAWREADPCAQVNARPAAGTIDLDEENLLGRLDQESSNAAMLRHGSCSRHGRSILLTMASAFLLLVALGNRLQPRVAGVARPDDMGWEDGLISASALDSCRPDEDDTDFWTGVSLYEVQGVSSSGACKKKCTGEPKCGAWTWGKRRNVKFLTDVCFLKELKPGHPMKKHDKRGVVSGVPCRPGEHKEDAGLVPATSVEPKFNCETGYNNWKAGWSTAKKKWCCAHRERACESGPPSPEPDHEKAAPLVECHDVAHDIDYWTGTPLYEVDDIGQAADCRGKCEEDPKCGAWTWGENPGVTGLEGVCFLKGLGDGHHPKQHHKKGVQSGVPCRSADGGPHKPPGGVVTPPHPTGHGNCGELEDDVDYSTSASLSEVINVATAEICLRKCEGEHKCGAWSWGKARHSFGLTDVCFLKGLRKGETPKRVKKDGVVSGTPCHTASWLEHQAEGGGTGLQHYQSATLNCFALMLPHSYEQELLRMQYYLHASLFACDQYSVYSNMSIEVAPGLLTHVVQSDLHCSFGGEFGTALNTDIFLEVWKVVINDGIYLTCDWTAKVDPDAVFMPARLRGALESHTEAPEGVFLNNCWRGMHGPVEVFSRNAVQSWATGMQTCIDHFKKLCHGDCLWGEDMFVDQCLWKVLDVRRDNEYALLIEDHCDPPDGWKSCKMSGISFHPFKKAEDYQECLFNADPALRYATTFTTTTVTTQAPAFVYPTDDEPTRALPAPEGYPGGTSDDANLAGSLPSTQSSSPSPPPSSYPSQTSGAESSPGSGSLNSGSLTQGSVSSTGSQTSIQGQSSATYPVQTAGESTVQSQSPATLPVQSSGASTVQSSGTWTADPGAIPSASPTFQDPMTLADGSSHVGPAAATVASSSWGTVTQVAPSTVNAQGAPAPSQFEGLS